MSVVLVDAVRPDLDRLDLWPLLVLSSPQPVDWPDPFLEHRRLPRPVR